MLVEQLPIGTLSGVPGPIPNIDEITLMKNGDRLRRILEEPPIFFFIKHVMNEFFLA